MRYLIFVIDNQPGTATDDEMNAIDAFNEQLQADGHWVMACGLAAPSDATLIDNRDGKGEQAKASLQSLDDYYSGFWLIDVDDHDTALRLATEGSRCCNRRVELRPLL
jgi:hypothetical protein